MHSVSSVFQNIVNHYQAGMDTGGRGSWKYTNPFAYISLGIGLTTWLEWLPLATPLNWRLLLARPPEKERKKAR
jgi:hypothetical protein